MQSEMNLKKFDMKGFDVFKRNRIELICLKLFNFKQNLEAISRDITRTLVNN